MLDSMHDAANAPTQQYTPGAVLLRRGECADQLLHLESGRVVLGLLDQGGLHHQLGVVEGPFWLEAASGLLGLAHAVDAVAETAVQLQFVAVDDFVAEVRALPAASQNLLMDLAKAQRQQLLQVHLGDGVSPARRALQQALGLQLQQGFSHGRARGFVALGQCHIVNRIPGQQLAAGDGFFNPNTNLVTDFHR